MITTHILLIEPNHSPQLRNIADTLEAMQHIVGGNIQAVYPFEEPVALICNEEAEGTGNPTDRNRKHHQGRSGRGGQRNL